MDFAAVSQVYLDYEAADLRREIHPDDNMWHSGPDWYFSVGTSAIRAILLALSLSWRQEFSRILDLPCGHGRVSRHLRVAFPQAELFCCDLDRSGVDFCADNFDGARIYSDPELTKVTLPRNLDLIWIGSLFTHLDEARTRRWLSFLADHLSEHGVLVATFHGLFSIENQKINPFIAPEQFSTILQGFERTGYGYASYRTDPVPDALLTVDEYGVSVSHPSKILELATQISDMRILSYTERGWANNHDVLSLTRHNRLQGF